MEQPFGKAEQGKPTAIERLVARETKDVDSGWNPESLNDLSREEKSQYFYDLVVTVRQARATGDDEGARETLSRMKALMETDPASVEYFSKAFTKARTDQHIVERSSLFRETTLLASDIKTLSAEYVGLKQRVFTGEITGIASRKNAEERIRELSRKIVAKQGERAERVALKGIERSGENTDIAASESYATIRRYHEEAKEGFAWLPSRVEINQKILAALKNGRFPLLVGEPGTGKSEQADAVARDLTGEPCVKVACTSSTGEHDLILEKEVEAGTSYHEYGGVTQAFTGYEKSTDMEPAYPHGRVVRLDEFLKINFDKSFGLIKEIGQMKEGEQMHRKVRHPKLPGSAIIATTNPAGTRHHLDPMLPALEREFAEIKVDYLPMSSENPELYEFMLATLMDEKGYIALPKGEIAPAYVEKEVAGEQKTADGRNILREQEIVPDVASRQHGTLYRLAFAVKALEDSYVANNPDERPNYADKLLRIENGKISQNGEELTLESSTLTLKEISSWMRGFEHRFEETNEAMHVKTLSGWFAYKAGVFISQCPKQDQEKLTAIFDHFGILNPEAKEYDRKPMTNMEIGYLSPRVPRPLIVEEKVKPADVPDTETEQGAGFQDRDIESVEYLTTEGERVRVLKQETAYGMFDGETVPLAVDEVVRFFDMPDDSGIPQEGVFVGLVEGSGDIALRMGDLVRVFSKEAFESKMKEVKMKESFQELEREADIFGEWYPEFCPGIA